MLSRAFEHGEKKEGGLRRGPRYALIGGMETIRFLVVFLTLISAAAAGDRPDTLRKSAERGDAKAQCNLGRVYYVGQGVAKDPAEAVKWFSRSAEQGIAEAQFNLGIAYWFGEGVIKDPVEAVNWYRKAAEQGLAKAQFNLGCAYGSGVGAIKDSSEAVNWHRKAADQGLASAQFCLGIAYWLGEGARKDPVEALAWVNVASAFGYEPARAWRESLEKDVSSGQIDEATRRARELMEAVRK